MRRWRAGTIGRPAAPVLLAACLALAGIVAGAHAHAATGDDDAVTRREAAAPRAWRTFEPILDGRWIGDGIAYGPHRDGQSPGGAQPTRQELSEDLHLIARHWQLLRIYNSIGAADTILSVIRDDRLPLRVMLGVWLAPETRTDSAGAARPLPANAAANRAEVAAGIRLANAYPDVVIAISAGNETQVSWSDHRFGAAQLIRDIRALRAETRVPVTTDDDYNFWNKPESRAVADEVDFIAVHAHPMWNGITLDHALGWTERTVASILAAHPGRTVVLGETGWATRRANEGEQARLIKGVAGEPDQKVFFDQVSAWARRTRTTTFFFEAFDENWKGGPNPDEVEKHWGLYRADRTPKLAMEGAP